MRKEFLVLYDYRKGGVWAYLMAESADQIEQMFPELKVVTDHPAWLTEDEERKLRARMTIDIDDIHNLFLASLIDSRRQET